MFDKDVVKPITGMNNYLISARGRVYRDAFICFKKNGQKIIFSRTEIAPYITHGYKRVNLRVNGKRKSYGISRLVAGEFCQGKSKFKNMVNHKDGNKLNNDYQNLEWVSINENRQHAYDTGLQKGQSGVDNPMCNTPIEVIDTVISLLKDGKYTQKEISKLLKVNYKKVNAIKCGRLWKIRSIELGLHD